MLSNINISSIQRKILEELQSNARIADTALARKIKTSKQVVQYNINALEEKKIIQGYYTIVDLQKTNQHIHVLYIRTQQCGPRELSQWIQSIEKIREVLTVARNKGAWDLTIVLKSSTFHSVESTLYQIIGERKKQIHEYKLTTEISSTYLSINFNRRGPQATTGTRVCALDQTDTKILELLSKNCRLSATEIARKVPCSTNTVIRRIKDLESQKVILMHRAKINFEALGYSHYRVQVHLMDYSKALFAQIKSWLEHQGLCESISHYIGYADIDFRCYARTSQELHQQLDDFHEEFVEHIQRIESMLIYDWQQIQYRP